MSGDNADNKNELAQVESKQHGNSESGLGRHRSFMEQVKTNHEIGEPYGSAQASQNNGWRNVSLRQPEIDQVSIHVAGSDDQDDGHIYPKTPINTSANQSPEPGLLRRTHTIGEMLREFSFENPDTSIDYSSPQYPKKRQNERIEPSSLKLAKKSPQPPGPSKIVQKRYPNLSLLRNIPKFSQQRSSWPTRLAATHNATYSAPNPNTEGETPPESPATDSTKTQPPSSYLSSQSRKNSTESTTHVDDSHTGLVLQPDSRTMPEGQLAAEIKAIYSGLVTIEAKCINVVNTENSRLEQVKGGSPSTEWTSLIALHRALLQEHHDFFLASQHPMSSEQLRSLANKHSMPARMWKHGIHSFLELLRHSLPNSMEFMQAFIILAYQMISLLYETVESFKDTWIECLGDLARYRMAIEEIDIKDREIWTNVSRSWYNKASRRNVNIGRLYHHQAILARTQPLKQLSLYARSLAAVTPFNSARESILTLFDPILSRINHPGSNTTSIDSRFMRLIAMRFTQRHLKEHYEPTLKSFLAEFDESIYHAGHHWRLIGEYMAFILMASILMWGEQTAAMHRILVRKDSNFASRRMFPTSGQNPVEKEYREHLSASRACKSRLAPEWYLLRETLTKVLTHRDNDAVLPFIYVIVCFVEALSSVQYGPEYLDDNFPFEQLSNFMNYLEGERKRVDSKSEEPSGDDVVLPEEQRMKGQAWVASLFPPKPNPAIEAEVEDYQERKSPMVPRKQKETILRRGQEIAAKGAAYALMHRSWLSYSRETQRYSAPQRYLNNPAPVTNENRGARAVEVVDLDHSMADYEEV